MAVALAAALAVLPSAAFAHPHVWVSVEATVLYDNGKITGLQQAWTFDEFYTAQAIEGLDKNGDGKYDRKELAELAQVNIDGLKEFDYFTFAKLANTDLKFAPPRDYWLEYTAKGILKLHFLLPLQSAIPAKAPGFAFSVYDPSYFIAFDFAKVHPVTLGAHAPAGCTASIRDPAEDNDNTNKTKQLNQAFSATLGTGSNLGLGGFQTAAIQCGKS